MSLDVFCDDVLRIIIEFLDDDGCVMLARTCHHLHDLVHDVQPLIIATDNVFEAVRNGLFVSFVHAWRRDLKSKVMEMRNINADILSYIHNYDLEPRLRDDHVAYRLCKIGVLTRITNDPLIRNLVIHAITHNKHALLTYTESLCNRIAFQQYCAYGYAKTGNHDEFVKCRRKYDMDMLYYAHMGGNKNIIDIVNTNRDFRGDIPPLNMKTVIKCDDITKYEQVSFEKRIVIMYIIRYNALNIVRTYNIRNIIRGQAYYAVINGYAVDMTMEMAELLLKVTDNNVNAVALIVSACNYRLTEMLRARGLYDKKLTVRSSHIEFTI